MTAEQPTEIDRAWADLAKAAQGIIPHRIHGQAMGADARAYRDDLLVLARYVDNVVAAYGQEARSHGLISEKHLSEFTDQLLGALDGNATSVLEQGGEQADEDAREFRADRAGWARANMMGVD